ncbi:MAG: hypothetical protein ABIJ18_01515 [archaeon]
MFRIKQKIQRLLELVKEVWCWVENSRDHIYIYYLNLMEEKK